MKARDSFTHAQLERGVMAAVVVRADAPWPAGRLVLPDPSSDGVGEELDLDLPNEHIVIPAVLLN